MADLFRLENQSKADFGPRRARLLVTLTIRGLPGFFCNLIRWRWRNGDEYGENSGGN